MDKRIALKKGSKLSFPGMECEIESTAGRGSNAIVYHGRYRDSHNDDLFHHVLIKELFPYHPKGDIFRLDDGSIKIENSAESFYDIQKISFEYGNSVHLRMLEKFPERISSNINTFRLNNTLYSVMGFDGGRTLDKECPGTAESLMKAAQLVIKLLDALDIFHSSGYLHLDISPDNVLLLGKDDYQRVTLIDYNSVQRLDVLRQGTALYRSAKEGYSSPEVINNDILSISQSADLYSVAAVFYRLLTGKILSDFQRLCKKTPDVKDSPLLKGIPETAARQVNTILYRGLARLPSRRYSSCDEMKKDILELINRIEGVGITHAALWESGRVNLNRMIRSNPSLRYLQNDSEIYPLRTVNDSSESFSLDETVSFCLDSGSIVLYGGGGAGKTTALLHTAAQRSRCYSALSPVTLYISLYDYNNGGGNYIKNRILQELRFDESITSMEDARHHLVRLFSECIKTPKGQVPKLLLLIDGFNEAGGDTTPLTEEISFLSTLSGVRIILSSRSEISTPGFRNFCMAPLQESDIRKALSQKGLVYPEEPQIQKLLENPFMLSVFCKASSESGRQLLCTNADEILEEYLTGLCDKAIKNRDDDSSERWCTEAAVRLVLPMLCAEIDAKKRLLCEKDILDVIKKCYRLISKDRLKGLFPQWIGHSKAIFAGCRTPEEWYGVVVHCKLWRELGLLVKEDSGYRVMHQSLQEYLVDASKTINKKIRTQSAVMYSGIACAAIAVIVLWSLFIRPQPCDKQMTRAFLDSATVSLSYSSQEIGLIKDMLTSQSYKSDDIYIQSEKLSDCIMQHSMIIEKGISGSLSNAETAIERLNESGDVLPWSGKVLDSDSALKLFELGKEVCEKYGTYADILIYISENDDIPEAVREEYINALTEKAELDAQYSDALFSYAFSSHFDGMMKKEPDIYEQYVTVIDGYADLTRDEPSEPTPAEIGRLRNESKEKALEIESMQIYMQFLRSKQ